MSAHGVPMSYLSEKLDAIAKREREATVGPWVHQSTPTGIRHGGTYDFIVLPEGGIIAERHVNGTRADAEFIAAARTDVTFLLALVREQVAKLARVEGIHQPIDAAMYAGVEPRKVQVCTGCGQDDGNWQRWPCPTVRALGGKA